MEENKTKTIAVSEETKKKMDEAKVHHRETYEELILRILPQKKEEIEESEQNDDIRGENTKN